MAGYWNHRLRFYIGETASVVESNSKFQISGQDSRFTDIGSLTKFLESAGDNETANEQLARTFIHLTTILNNMHQVHDYGARRVIPAGDAETWLGYFDDFGPHPVFLAAVWNWLERVYMTRSFYAIAEYRLSGKKELLDFLEGFKADEEAQIFINLLNEQAVAPDGGLRQFRPLDKRFYTGMAKLISQRASATSAKKVYGALAKAAVFDDYIVNRPEYSSYVNQLVPDENENPPETIADVLKRRRR